MAALATSCLKHFQTSLQQLNGLTNFYMLGIYGRTHMKYIT